MPTREEVMSALRNTPAANQRLAISDWELSENTPGERSVIASKKVKRPVAVRPNTTIDLHLVAHETFTTDGTGGNTETFNLSHDLVDAASVVDDVVLYEAGTGEVEPDTVDYAADSFDYTDDGTANDLNVYYVLADQARLELRASAPRNHQKTIKEVDAGLVNYRDQMEDPIEFEPSHELQGVVPSDWTLELVATAPYDITWDHDDDGDVEAINAALDVPIRRSDRDIPGLENLVIDAIP